jgi:hypothetical protein
MTMSQNFNQSPTDSVYDRPLIRVCVLCRKAKLAQEMEVVFKVGEVCSECRFYGNAVPPSMEQR